MQIADKTVVAIDYVLKDDAGEVIDSSEGQQPLTYLHGASGIIPGLERELTGKQVGDELQVSIAPADGYGGRNDGLRQEVAHDQFQGVQNLSVGMQFQADSNAGPMVVTVVEISDATVTIDGNHPLAGMNLNFSVTVRDIREATQEELQHGHAHGPGGHSH
ncbi:MAG: peptidylprolyl isomerase [Planctomycetaceae bacterium]|nr:peptidylprolyl isomerase [Planctomycetaceae bacterium]